MRDKFKPRRTKWQKTVLALGVTISITLLAASVAVAAVWIQLGNRKTFSIASLTPVGESLTTLPASIPNLMPTVTAPPAPLGPAVNILIVGIDSGTGLLSTDPVNSGRSASANTDTMIVARLDPATRTGSLLSIPRDLYVPIAGTNTTDRINSARSHDDGRDRLVRTIQTDLGIPINHYIEVDFKGFQVVVDALGGVSVNFPVAVRDLHTGLAANAGCQTLDGKTALDLVRSRYLQQMGLDGRWHYDVSSDWGRLRRQQAFLQTLASKAIAHGATNPITALNLLTAATNNVGTSTTLSIDALTSLLSEFKSLTAATFTDYTLPTDSIVTNSGQDVLQLRTIQATPTLDIFRGYTAQPAASTAHPASYNPSSIDPATKAAAAPTRPATPQASSNVADQAVLISAC